MSSIERAIEQKERSQQLDKVKEAERHLREIDPSQETQGSAVAAEVRQLENEIRSAPSTDEIAASEANYRKVERDATLDARDRENTVDSEGETAGKPLKFGELDPNAYYEKNGYGYETDQQGRVETVWGEVQLGDEKRTHHQTEVGKQGRESDEGGHYIGARFKGSPEGVNLFPQDMNLNRGDWKAMENRWAEAIKDGQAVEVAIHAGYENGSNRPSTLYVWEKIGSDVNEWYFENEPHGEVK